MTESVDVAASILNSTKKALGLSPTYDPFDPELIMYINNAFATLNQLGIGPDEGFAIESDAETWDDLLGDDKRFNGVKAYVAFKTRLAFDPPANSFTQEALKQQINELEWRLTILAENFGWTGNVTVITPT